MNPIVVLPCMALLLAAACATVPGSPPMVVECKTKLANDRPGPALVGVEYGVQATAVPLNSVQFTDWETAKQVAVQQILGERTSTGTVRVTARFTSCSDDSSSILVRTSFFTLDQTPTEAPSAWKRVYLPARSSAVYSELSTSMNAANFLIEINTG